MSAENLPIYTDLPTPTSFRVLHLEPGAYRDDVYATLEVADLENPPPYQALSYVWGPELPRIPLTCNTHLTSTTENLTYALRNIRNATSPITLWVDAICINQTSIPERTSQVLLMRQIYAKSTQVIIWLGLEQSYIDAALALLALAARRSAEQNPDEILDMGSTVEVTWSAKDNEEMGFPPRGPDWYPLRWLLSRPWFRRIWVVQEAATSMDSLIMIGEKTFKWHDLIVALFWFEQRAYPTWVWQWDVTSPFVLFFQSLSETKLTLVKLWFMAKGMGFLSTDPRDMLFALFGLSVEGLEEVKCKMVVPDYGLELREVYTNLVRHYVQCVHKGQTNNLDVLSLVSHTSETLTGKRSPSWIIQEDVDKPRGYPHVSQQIASLNVPVELREPITDTSIVLKGIIISRITDSDKSLDKTAGFEGNHADIFHIVKNLWTTHSSKIIPTLGVDAAKQLFVDVLTHKIVYDGRMRTAADLDAFLLHDPEAERWADVGIDNDVMVSMKGASTFLQSLRAESFFVADNGMLGTGAVAVEKGDLVCVLFGGRSPFVLRRRIGERCYVLVGSCYVGGLQKGEGIEMWRAGEVQEGWFDIR